MESLAHSAVLLSGEGAVAVTGDSEEGAAAAASAAADFPQEGDRGASAADGAASRAGCGSAEFKTPRGSRDGGAFSDVEEKSAAAAEDSDESRLASSALFSCGVPSLEEEGPPKTEAAVTLESAVLREKPETQLPQQQPQKPSSPECLGREGGQDATHSSSSSASSESLESSAGSQAGEEQRAPTQTETETEAEEQESQQREVRDTATPECSSSAESAPLDGLSVSESNTNNALPSSTSPSLAEAPSEAPSAATGEEEQTDATAVAKSRQAPPSPLLKNETLKPTTPSLETALAVGASAGSVPTPPTTYRSSAAGDSFVDGLSGAASRSDCLLPSASAAALAGGSLDEGAALTQALSSKDAPPADDAAAAAACSADPLLVASGSSSSPSPSPQQEREEEEEQTDATAKARERERPPASSAWAFGVGGVLEGGGALSARGSHCQLMQRLKQQVNVASSLDKAVLLFNKEGLGAALEWLAERNLLDRNDHHAVARFLFDTPGLCKTKVGGVLGDCSAFSLLVLQSFASLCDYRGLTVDEALRQMLSKFKPPGEAQQVYRLLFHFAGQYVKHNKERGLTLDTVHFLAYAILMLHTDRHNPKVKRKMNKEQFKKIVAAGGAQIPEDAVECMYDRVVAHEFRLQITESDRVYSRLVNDPRALRHLPGSFRSEGVAPLAGGRDGISSSPSAGQTSLEEARLCSWRSTDPGRGAPLRLSGVQTAGDLTKEAQGSVDELGSAEALASAAGVSVEGASFAPPCLDSTGTSQACPPRALVEGSVFVKICRNGRMKRRLIRVSPDAEQLLWSSPAACEGEKGAGASAASAAKAPPKALLLDALQDITVGCLYSEAGGVELSHELESRCVSLQFSSRRLELLALDLPPWLFAQWVGFFHQQVALRQQMRQRQLRQRQQRMSSQQRQLVLQQQRAAREEAAASNLSLWRERILPQWDAHWTCGAVPVAVPSRPSALALSLDLVVSASKAVARFPRAVALRYLNRSSRLHAPGSGPASARRSSSPSGFKDKCKASLSRARAASLRTAAAGGVLVLRCGRSCAETSRRAASAIARRAEEARMESGGFRAKAGLCLGLRTLGEEAERDPLAAQRGLAPTPATAQTALRANAYSTVKSLGASPAWGGRRYTLDRGQRLETALSAKVVQLWLLGVPGELRGKLWLIATGNAQRVDGALLQALLLSDSREAFQEGGQTTGLAERLWVTAAAGTAPSQATPQEQLLKGADGQDEGRSQQPPTSQRRLLVQQLGRTPLRGIPYLMKRKVGEGPSLLTTLLDELRVNSAEAGGGASSPAEAQEKSTLDAALPNGLALSKTALPTPEAALRPQLSKGPASDPTAAASCARAATTPGQNFPAEASLPSSRTQSERGTAGWRGFSERTLQSAEEAGAVERGEAFAAPALSAMPSFNWKQSLSFAESESAKVSDSTRNQQPLFSAAPPTPFSSTASCQLQGAGAEAAFDRKKAQQLLSVATGLGSAEGSDLTIAEGVRILLEAYVQYRYACRLLQSGPELQRKVFLRLWGSLQHPPRKRASVRRPDVGYVRGMDVLASMLLCFLPVDLAFTLFSNLILQFHLLDFFCPAAPASRRLVALKFDFFDAALSSTLPHLHTHLSGLRVIPDLYLMRWIETLFCRVLPFSTLCRVWDALLLMGEAYCFQVALGLLKYHESALLCNSFEGCLAILNSHVAPTADEDGTFDARRFFKCVEVCRIDGKQYGEWLASQRMSEEKAELLEVLACSIF